MLVLDGRVLCTCRVAGLACGEVSQIATDYEESTASLASVHHDLEDLDVHAGDEFERLFAEEIELHERHVATSVGLYNRYFSELAEALRMYRVICYDLEGRFGPAPTGCCRCSCIGVRQRLQFRGDAAASRQVL